MTTGFVGRSAELGELVARLDDALAGRAGVVVLAGEPGIGKTRLVGELARLAGARNVPELWGRCTDEEGAPAYWPWRLALRSWVAAADPAEATALLGDGAADRARIAPEVARLAGCAPAASASGPEQRFAQFDVTARLPARCRELLATAAVVGVEVNLAAAYAALMRSVLGLWLLCNVRIAEATRMTHRSRRSARRGSRCTWRSAPRRCGPSWPPTSSTSRRRRPSTGG